MIRIIIDNELVLEINDKYQWISSRLLIVDGDINALIKMLLEAKKKES